MADNNLLGSDLVFIDELKNWMRTSLEYSVKNKKPLGGDLVLLQADFKVGSILLRKGAFLKIIDLIQLCESTITSQAGYDVWLQDVDKEVARLAESLDAVDGARIQEFFNIFRGIEIPASFSQRGFGQKRGKHGRGHGGEMGGHRNIA